MDMLKIRLLNDDDVPLMENWLNKEHIKKWYEVPGLCSIDDWLSEIRGRNDEFKFITHFIALWEEHPIGFCQYYKCADIEEDWYGDTPLSGTYSIDYLIGEETYLGKGIGKSIITLLIKEIFSLTDAKRIIVQPDEDNKASCNALLSNGFTFDNKNNIYKIIGEVLVEQSTKGHVKYNITNLEGYMNTKIRSWRIEDAESLTKVMNNNKVQDNLRDGLPFPYTISDAKDFISAMLTADKNNTFAWAITVDDIAVGSIGVFRKDNIHRLTAELGYCIAEKYWGKGIATEAVRQVCAYIFENTDIVRIFAEPYSLNTGSCRVLEKAGFVYEGTLRRNAVKNGQIVDMKMYAVINH